MCSVYGYTNQRERRVSVCEQSDKNDPISIWDIDMGDRCGRSTWEIGHQ